MQHEGRQKLGGPPSLGIVLYSTVPTDGQLVVVVVDPTELFFLLVFFAIMTSPRLFLRPSSCAWHAFVFLIETIAAVLIGTSYSCAPAIVEACIAAAVIPVAPDCCMDDSSTVPFAADDDESLHNVDVARLSWDRQLLNIVQPNATNETVHGRRLAANNEFNYNADYSRRLTFHTWLEEDVVLDRRGLARYLRLARSAAGLSTAGARGRRASARKRIKSQQPSGVEALERELAAGSFAFDASFAAQAHHVMQPGAPWGHGRDEFMHFVRHGLRPTHHFLSLGCGPLATGHHIVRYLLAGRYHCLEQDEYLLRAAVEYEIPANGLIHKRPRLVLGDLAEDGAIKAAPPVWLPASPSLFDFVAVQRALVPDQLKRVVSNAARHLKPRSGRLVLLAPLSTRQQLQLGLKPSDYELDGSARSKAKADPLAACPFSLSCALYTYRVA